MLRKFVGLREIPARSLGLIMTPAAQNGSACMIVNILVRPLPDVAYHIHYTKLTCTCGVSVHVAGGQRVSSLVGKREIEGVLSAIYGYGAVRPPCAAYCHSHS